MGIDGTPRIAEVMVGLEPGIWFETGAFVVDSTLPFSKGRFTF